jgi:uncharacterized protein YndB with AHSA1/START domain
VAWRALTDATELMRWFPFTAAVEPGKGGKITWDWGDLYHWPLRIDVWEPGHRLRLIEERADPTGKRVLLSTEFLLEGRGGSTLLRVVAAGFGKTTDWDDEYDGVRRGWLFELRSLRHYLAHHRGVDRKVAWARKMTPTSPAELHRALLAPQTLDGLLEGDRYRLVLPGGDTLEGTVVRNEPPMDFAGTVDNWNNGLLRFQAEGGGVMLWLATYGADAAKVDEIQGRFRGLLDRLA